MERSYLLYSKTALASAMLFLVASLVLPLEAAAAGSFHFESICRSDPSAHKNSVTVTLHDEFHNPLPYVTLNALWSYVDYRQNHAVFSYKQASCSTGTDGVCVFNGQSGRARWQLNEVVGYDLGTPVFDTTATESCPNTLMIDFW